jgi:hypothetical protein
MGNWITCTQLDGRVVILNMNQALFVTEEAGNQSAICFGSGTRDRMVVRESKERLAELISDSDSPSLRGVVR